MTKNLTLVTGAGRGIGRAIALRLAQESMPVVLVARSDGEITEVRNEIVEAGGLAYACPCDITNADEVKALAKDISEEVGTVNILVSNAGIAPTAKFEDITEESWRETFAVNVDGAFHVMQAFLPAMKQGGGHVIAIASTAALQGARFTSAYTASKHALLGLMRALAEEMKDTGIIFSTICPGFTRTSLLEESIDAAIRRGRSREVVEHALGAMNREGRLIEPNEIAEMVDKIVTSKPRSGLIYFADGTLAE